MDISPRPPGYYDEIDLTGDENIPGGCPQDGEKARLIPAPPIARRNSGPNGEFVTRYLTVL